MHRPAFKSRSRAAGTRCRPRWPPICDGVTRRGTPIAIPSVPGGGGSRRRSRCAGTSGCEEKVGALDQRVDHKRIRRTTRVPGRKIRARHRQAARPTPTRGSIGNFRYDSSLRVKAVGAGLQEYRSSVNPPPTLANKVGKWVGSAWLPMLAAGSDVGRQGLHLAEKCLDPGFIFRLIGREGRVPGYAWAT